ncbi:MAG TPA: ATP-binding protein [Steroidobacteraceae bacterium]|jgi:signal transduction histidine kinase
MNTRSLPFRLAAWYALLLGATFLLVSFVVFYGLQHYLRANLRGSVMRRTTEVEQILLRMPASPSNEAIAADIELHLAPAPNNRFIRVTRMPDQVVFLSGPPANGSFNRFTVGSVLPAPAADSTATTILPDQHLLIGASAIDTVSGRYVVELGSSTLSIETTLERLVDLLAILLPLLIACAAAGGYFLVTWALRPVDRLSQTAEQMSLQNLALRLPVVQSGDALERLAISLNNLLGRLRDSVQSSRRFLADASHELRTPLTVIKGELQELSGDAHLNDNEMRERVGSVLEEVARLEHLVSGLLVISRLDAGETQRESTDVNLAHLALNTAEQMRLMAEDRGIAIDLFGLNTAIVRGDPARLKQIIVNLLDNAIRFTPSGGSVILRTREGDAGSILEVIDTGIGIPASAIPRVFDRFFRVDEGRSREDGGAGLGLSIVKSVCSMHGAEIDVTSQPRRGSCFRVRFPRRLASTPMEDTGQKAKEAPADQSVAAPTAS